MLQIFEFFAPCPRGLEPILEKELLEHGAKKVKVTDGGVAFSGPWTVMYKANLYSRVASRILWKLVEKPYRTEDDIFRMARDTEWAEIFTVENSIKVTVTAVRSPLRSLDFIALKVKDGVCDRFRLKCGKRPDVDTKEPDMRIHLYLSDKMATLYLDTSGEALFKRGYRVETGDAPVRENLAAGILALSGWTPEQAFYDPMCGSGTFLIEAAMIARNIAPGIRRSFAFQQMRMFDDGFWQGVRAEAKAKETKSNQLISGSDVSSTVLIYAKANIAAAGLEDAIQLKQLNVLDAKPPAESGVWVCNPPYGARMDEKEHLAGLYPQWATVLKQRFAGWNAYFLTADLDMPKYMRLKASKRTVLFNGPLECRLFEYKMIAGGNRDKPTKD
ncbi:class I SAM-dependent RNA methyltransferase [Chitinibacter sp. GC72]|uniref:THUMP domain-containing class I SAM-dependent RNA methyltransferase n=1 Tax=Chitinibacter sp. GC72 TaxID=1526917 RepID=UPI0018DF3ECC|nr:class I SAM-dependent RNA methyltransferase [Chitinibacter sp. GC72]